MKTITEITATKQEPEYIRLAAYCRVSSNSEDQLHSFAAQIQYYTEYVQKIPQYRLVDIYADEGITGTSMNKRDELNRLLRDCKNGLIDRIIVKSVSRLARNTEELLTMLRLLSEIGVSVYFEENGIDTNMMSSEMLVTFPGMAAQQESLAISGNMRWSYKKRMEAGEFNCCAPAYGFKLVDGKMEIDETEAATVRRIFSMYLQGIGKQAIANILNAEGVKRNHRRDKWYDFTVDYILKNERYMGDALLQKTFTTGSFPFKKRLNRGEKPQYYVESSNPAIISKEMFENVQNLLAQKKNSVGDDKGAHLLTKMLRCPECGKTFRRQIIKGTAYWICSSKASGVTNCRSVRVKENEVYNTFVMLSKKLYDNSEYLLEPLINQMTDMQHKTNDNYQQIKDLDRQISDLNAQNHILARLHTKGILSQLEYSKQSAEIKDKVTRLRIERRKILSEDEDAVSEVKALHEIISKAKINDEFSAELFENIVTNITVQSNSALTFELLGGIRLTEEIWEKGRCKNT